MTRRLFVLSAALLALVLIAPSGDAQETTTAVGAGAQEELVLLASALLPEETIAPALLVLTRYSFAPGAVELAPSGAPASALVYVEAGTVTVRVEDMVIRTRTAETGIFGPGETVAAGTEIALGPGDGVFIPAGTLTQARNDGPEPAVAVVAFLESGDADVADAGDTPGVTITILGLGNAPALPAGPSALTLVRLTSPAGSAGDRWPVGGPLVVHVEAGSYAYTVVSGVHKSLVIRGVDTWTPEDELVVEQVAPGVEVTLNAGDAVFESDGTVSQARRSGTEPAVALFVAVISVGEGSPVGSPATTPAT